MCKVQLINKSVELNLDYYCDEDVFATTEKHLVYLNANLFSDVEYLKTESNVEVIRHVKENLSLYSAEYEDGREIISECFSGYYSRVNNSFAMWS